MGYSRVASQNDWKPSLRDKMLRAVYPAFLENKLRMKMKTLLGRFSSLAELELTPEASAQADAPSTAS